MGLLLKPKLPAAVATERIPPSFLAVQIRVNAKVGVNVLLVVMTMRVMESGRAVQVIVTTLESVMSVKVYVVALAVANVVATVVQTKKTSVSVENGVA